MPLKPVIHHGVAAAAVADRAAHEYRSIIDAARLAAPAYTVLAYPGMRGESSSIVDSRSVAKAIEKARLRGEPIVAIAHNFTSEAMALLHSHAAVIVRLRDHHWSDASFASLRRKR